MPVNCSPVVLAELWQRTLLQWHLLISELTHKNSCNIFKWAMRTHLKYHLQDSLPIFLIIPVGTGLGTSQWDWLGTSQSEIKMPECWGLHGEAYSSAGYALLPNSQLLSSQNSQWNPENYSDRQPQGAPFSCLPSRYPVSFEIHHDIQDMHMGIADQVQNSWETPNFCGGTWGQVRNRKGSWMVQHACM